jgi:hypothetical protein
MKRFNLLALALGAGAALLLLVLSAKADLAQTNDGAPFVIVKSSGGQITVRPSEPEGMVRVPGSAPGVQMSRFNVKAESYGTFSLPGLAGAGHPGRRPGRGFNIPAQQFTLRNLHEGPHGVQIDNAGSDLPVGVPNRFEAMVINAGPSPVLMEQTHGPYAIVGQSDVTLHGVTGNGMVRTSGNVEVRNPAGRMRIDEIAGGRVVLQSSSTLDAARINSVSGDVEWTVNGVGGGPYYVSGGTGLIKILVRPGVGANISAFSLGGSVANYVDPAMGNVTLARPHAVSLTVGGGGPQIVVQSESGNIVIATAQ